ncbi:putative methyltransferase [Undibacterium sp. GrIS 1.8]|uniref:class I SAM-dependent methyltransferase n=1 Tax=unclassified Undibacterium TaxID=2630295 RepID=UPI0033920A3D
MNFPQSHLINKSRLFLTVSALLCGVLNPVIAQTNVVDSGLDTVIKGVWRSDENRARDQYRHPKQTLEFFGVQANATVIEITPGGSAWYGEILAPFLKEKGHYIAANIDGTKVSASSAAYQTRTADAQNKKFLADPERYSKARTINFDPAAPQFGPANSADYVLTFRNVHNWVGDHTEVLTFKAMFDVLKPGGVLGVVDHRAAAGKTLDAKLIDTGYLPEEYVIALAQQAGFKLVGKSEVNANPKDTKDYVKGVWTLPPTYADKENNRQKYKEIGESDRFTLRFVKP